MQVCHKLSRPYGLNGCIAMPGDMRKVEKWEILKARELKVAVVSQLSSPEVVGMAMYIQILSVFALEQVDTPILMRWLVKIAIYLISTVIHSLLQFVDRGIE